MKAWKPVLGALVAASLVLPQAVNAKEITIGLASEPTAMDPHFHNLGPNNAMSTHIFSRLIEQDTLIIVLSIPLAFGTWSFWLEPASLRNEDHTLALPLCRPHAAVCGSPCSSAPAPAASSGSGSGVSRPRCDPRRSPGPAGSPWS